MWRKPIVSVTDENERISIKNVCMYACMYVCNGFLSIYKVYQGWELKRSSPTDPPKQNGHKFVPTAPIGSKFRLGNTRLFSFPGGDFLFSFFLDRFVLFGFVLFFL